MTTAVLNIGESEKQPNAGFSEGNTFDVLYSASAQPNSELISIDKMNNPLTDDAPKLSPSQNSTENNPSALESAEDNQENKENDLAYEPSKNAAKRKLRNVLDSDSEKEDDFISSLLNKSYAEDSSGPLEAKIKKPDSGKLGKSSKRLIDSESEEENSAIAVKNINNENEDSSNEDENLVEPEIKKTRKSRFRTLIDSESEDDNESKPIQNSEVKSDENESVDEIPAKINKKQKISSIVDSTSDEEENSENSTARLSSVKNKKVAKDRRKKGKTDKKIVKSKFRTLVDSESEDNNKLMPTEKLQEENHEEATNDQLHFHKSKISSLIDTDSEDDGKRNDVDQTPRNEHQKSRNLGKSEKSAKKRTGSIRASKDEAMRQIHSETQRLIRSSEVSLPYHKPKQRSLQEFLNRKQFIPNLPEGLTTAAKVKMSSEIVGKVLEEKEKEAELFYKSSDSEEEVEIKNATPVDSQNKNEDPTSDARLVDHPNIENTQKIVNNDVQNAHNKKEIIQQCGVDLGVPRKLFANETEDLMENKRTETEANNEKTTEFEDPRKKTKETKQGLKEASVPRKLFGNDYEDVVASSKSQEILVESSQSSEIIETIAESVKSPIKNNLSNSLTPNSETSIKPQLEETPSDKNPESFETVKNNTIAEENNEFSNISETPFISNKEIAKLNEKGKTSRNHNDSDEKIAEDEDSGDQDVPIGHVYGLPPPDFEAEDRRAEKMNMIKKLQSDVVPKLRGSPGMFIDLSDDVKPNREGVQSLVDRFIRHSASNKPVESSSSVTVLHTEKTPDGLKVVEQILPYTLPTNDNINDKELSKPGAKYLRLKNELIEKMAKKRNEEWRLKEQQEKDEDPEEEEEIDDEYDSDADEETLQEELQVSGESEPEENDMPNEKKKKRKNHDFADEEAEVSGEDVEEDEENDEEMEVSDADDEEEEDNEENKVIDEDDDTCDILSNPEEETINKPKKPSRIVRAFEDDSNSLPENSVPNGIEETEKKFERTKTDVDIFANEEGNDGWLSDTEAEIPPSQIPRDQNDGRSQLCKTPLTAVNILRFVSPITQLTAFDSCNDSPKDGSASKGTPRPFLGLIDSSVEKTPFAKKSPYDSEKRNGFQKKLFEDPAGTVNDDELMDLCSGKFTGMENDDEAIESSSKLPERQLSDLCSGSFLSKGLESETFEKNGVALVDEASQDIKLTLDGDSEDSCDKIISKETANKPNAPWANFQVASSEDEDNSKDNRSEGNFGRKKLKKKKVKQLELSDEEDEQDSEEDEEDCQVLNNDNEDKYVDYDSEENEVVIVPKKDIKKVAAGFLDEEAELSESEWGSADEDEKDLDKLEIEEGDDEDIDENQMRDQLGKIHMRQVLDDDQREVRMLQELLFDDGDLHTEGSGRERQFKWKNIDNLGDDDNLGPRNDDIDENGDVIEEENDLEWRKQRFEREKFLEEEKKKNSEDKAKEELESDSQIFKLGMKALKKSKSIQISQREPDANLIKKPFVPRTVLDLLGSTTGQNSSILSKAAKRGSFLARGEECLARLAVQIKEDTTTITTRKNPRNFVFAHISPAVAGTAEKEQKVETETNDNSLVDAKTKKRKPPSDNTPRTAKKAKIEITRSSGKKLF